MAIIIVGARSPVSDSGFGIPDPPLSEEELRRAAAVVGDGMRFVYWLSSGLSQEERWAPGIRRAVGECWLMHASRLHAFYYGPRHVPRTVVAADYFARSDAWYEARPHAPTGFERGQGALPPPPMLVGYGPERLDESVPPARRVRELTSGLVELSAAFLGLLEEERLDWFAPSAETERTPWKEARTSDTKSRGEARHEDH